MLYSFYCILLIINYLFALFRKQSKIVSVVSVAFIGFLFVGNSSNPDLLNYIRYYENVIYSGFQSENILEVGYWLINKLANYIGLDFFQFKLVIFIVCSLLIRRTVIRYCMNYNLLVAFYMTYAMFMDIIQIRNFIALSLFIFAFPYLLDGTKNIKRYLLIIAFATLIHSSAVIYFIFLLIRLKNRKLLIRMGTFLSVLFVLFILANNNKMPFAELLLSSISDARFERYLTAQTRWGFLIPLFLQIINFVMVSFLRKHLLMKEQIQNEKKWHDFINSVYFANSLLFIITPLFMMTITFYRIPRNMIILNLMLASIGNQVFKVDGKWRWMAILLMIINILSWYLVDKYLITLDFSTLVHDPIFEFNQYIEDK